MLRQILVVLSFLLLGAFFFVGILSAVDTNPVTPAAADSGQSHAVNGSETERNSGIEAPADTTLQGISVKDQEEAIKLETPEPESVPSMKDNGTTSYSQDKQIYYREAVVIPDNKSIVTNNHAIAKSMIVPKDWSIDGKIVGDKDKKLIIAAGDTVYVNIGNDRVNNGDICFIYRKIGKVKDPAETGGILGYEVRRIGKIEITDSLNSRASSAKVIISYEPINIGDSVKIVQSEE